MIGGATPRTGRRTPVTFCSRGVYARRVAKLLALPSEVSPDHGAEVLHRLGLFPRGVAVSLRVLVILLESELPQSRVS